MHKKFTIKTAVCLCLLLIGVNVSAVTTLSDAITTALETNPSMLSRKASERAADRGVANALSGYYPSIDFEWARGREFSESRSLTKKLWLDRSESSLSLTMPLYEGGRTMNLVKQRKAELRGAGYDVKSRQETVALGTATAYLDVLQTTKLLRLAQENLKIHKKFLNQVEQKFTGGAGHIGDIDLIKARFALAKSRVIVAFANLKNAKANYFALVGKPSHDLEEPIAPINHLPASLVTANHLAGKNSPILKIASTNLSVAKSAVDSQKAQFLPNFNFVAGITRNRNLDGTRGPNRDKQLMLRMNYNLFNGGSEYTELQRLKHQATAMEQNLQDASRQVGENVTIAWHNYNKAKQNLDKQKEYVAATAGVVRAYKEQFNIGKRMLLNLLDAENEHYGARVQLTQSEYELKNSIYTLLATEGLLVPTMVAYGNGRQETYNAAAAILRPDSKQAGDGDVGGQHRTSNI